MKGRTLRWSLLGRLAALALATGGVEGCSLQNVAYSACEADVECRAAFGWGSTCDAGACTAPASCVTGHDCRREAGGGFCVEGACVATLPPDDVCNTGTTLHEPSGDDGVLSAPGERRLVGGLLPTSDDSYAAMAASARLAVREVNRAGGALGGEELGILFCDNAGTGEERKAKVEHAIDYLAGVVGAPFIVGPATSTDSLNAINRLLERQYPTALISPSATSPALAATPDKLSAGDPLGLFWRTVPSDELQGLVLATSVAPSLPMVQKIAVAHIQDAYGSGLANVFQGAWKDGGGAVELLPYQEGGDLGALGAQIVSSQADALLVIALDAQTALDILATLVGTPMATKPILLTDGAKEQTTIFAANVDPAVKAMFPNVLGTAPAAPAGALYDQFAANLQLDFGLSANSFAFLAQTYDAMYFGSAALVRASLAGSAYDGRDVAAGLASLSSGQALDVGEPSWPIAKGAIVAGSPVNLRGISGPLDFDAQKGEAPGPIEVWSIGPNSFQTEQVVAP